jgi:trans-aconitate 3-methyltransferase
VLSGDFNHVIGTDPSQGMISKARDSTSQAGLSNIEYHVAGAESLPFISDSSVDLVVAGQSSHWFDYAKVWPELKRILRKGGTMAFWGYRDPVYVGWPKASVILDRVSYGEHPDKALGRYWEPGRFIVRNLLRDIRPPTDIFAEVARIEYEPNAADATPKAGSGNPEVAVTKRMTVAQSMDYVRTFSSFHSWQEAHPQAKSRKQGGNGDLVDELYDEIEDVEGWKNEDMTLEMEWGSALILARKV